MNPIDDRVFYLLAGVVAGWLLHWLWARRPRRQAEAAPAVEPGTIIANPSADVSAAPASDVGPAQREPASSRLIDVGAARAAGFNIRHADDLTIIEGIGPKTSDLLRANGIGSFAQLARLHPADLADILEKGGPSFRLANPQTWPEQALLATENHWIELKRLQKDRIDGVMSAGNP